MLGGGRQRPATTASSSAENSERRHRRFASTANSNIDGNVRMEKSCVTADKGNTIRRPVCARALRTDSGNFIKLIKLKRFTLSLKKTGCMTMQDLHSYFFKNVSSAHIKGAERNQMFSF